MAANEMPRHATTGHDRGTFRTRTVLVIGNTEFVSRTDASLTPFQGQRKEARISVGDYSESHNHRKSCLFQRPRDLIAGLIALIWVFGCNDLPCCHADETKSVSSALIPRRRPSTPVLRTAGRHFVDEQGRVVILRGVNLTGDAKVPPFFPSVGPADLDLIRDLGFNVIRLLFIWEAYEPMPGVYDDAYANELRHIVLAARQRGISTIIDFHQDGFSRFTSRGAGDGFPQWAVSPRGRISQPDNGPACKNWAVLMVSDPTTHKSFDDFYSDRFGVRTRYLAMVGRAAAMFGQTPGVIGYDLLNEPWGAEETDLAPLYRDASRVIQQGHPGAISFLEGHLSTNCGLRTKLPRPDYGPVAYAPHYYRPVTVMLGRWHGATREIDRAFANMTQTSAEWNSPLFLGEFGVGAEAVRAGDYVSAVYDRLDACLASGAQWNYTSRWNDLTKDGWNGEDFNIIHPSGIQRPNFRSRPYPRATAGIPLQFRYDDGIAAGTVRRLDFQWSHNPALTETEIFLPQDLFPSSSCVEVHASGVAWHRDFARNVLICRSSRASVIHLTITAPRETCRITSRCQ